MISFSIRMPNWIGARGDFITGALKWFSFSDSGRLGKHKAWEVQTDYWGWGRLFELEIDVDWAGSDHAGPRFSLTLLGFMVAAQMYDTRHWDEDNNRWEEHHAR
jgi:hypothetical protein